MRPWQADTPARDEWDQLAENLNLMIDRIEALKEHATRRRPASLGPLSTHHPYQEDSHRRVEYRRSTKVDKAQGQAPIPQGAWRSTICEDPPPKNKKQPQRQSRKPRREASARNPPSQESHPIPSLLCLFSSRRD